MWYAHQTMFKTIPKYSLIRLAGFPSLHLFDPHKGHEEVAMYKLFQQLLCLESRDVQYFFLWG